MKKSEIINLLNNLLKTYEDCSMNGSSEEVLKLMEEQGILHPTHFEGKGLYGAVLKPGWEPEGITPKKKK